jgi:hypothetical protein
VQQAVRIISEKKFTPSNDFYCCKTFCCLCEVILNHVSCTDDSRKHVKTLTLVALNMGRVKEVPVSRNSPNYAEGSFCKTLCKATFTFVAFRPTVNQMYIIKKLYFMYFYSIYIYIYILCETASVV